MIHCNSALLLPAGIFLGIFGGGIPSHTGDPPWYKVLDQVKALAR